MGSRGKTETWGGGPGTRGVLGQAPRWRSLLAVYNSPAGAGQCSASPRQCGVCARSNLIYCSSFAKSHLSQCCLQWTCGRGRGRSPPLSASWRPSSLWLTLKRGEMGGRGETGPRRQDALAFPLGPGPQPPPRIRVPSRACFLIGKWRSEERWLRREGVGTELGHGWRRGVGIANVEKDSNRKMPSTRDKHFMCGFPERVPGRRGSHLLRSGCELCLSGPFESHCQATPPRPLSILSHGVGRPSRLHRRGDTKP